MLAERAQRRVHLPDHAGVRIVPPLVYLAALALGLILHWLMPIPLARDEGALVLRIVGIAMALVGAWLTAAALLRMRAVGTSPIPVRPTTALVLDGPYRHSRNPMYVGMLFASAGIALVVHALWVIVFLPVVVVIINREVIVREEKYLSRKFGGEYEVYKRRTRRWI